MKTRLLVTALLFAMFSGVSVSKAATYKLQISTDGGTTELANPTYATRTDGFAYTGISGNYHVFNSKKTSWTTLTDPVRVGFTFAGWKSNRVTNHQYMEDPNGNPLPIALSSWSDPVVFDKAKKDKYVIAKLGDDKEVSEFTEGLTVNVWAKVADWDADFIVKDNTDKSDEVRRIISCTQGSGWNIGEADVNGHIKYQMHDGTTTTSSGYHPVIAAETGEVTVNKKPNKLQELTWTGLTDNQWHMFTLTICGTGNSAHTGEFRGYVDGYSFDLVTGAGMPTAPTVPITIGAEPNGYTDDTLKFTANQYFHGEIRNLVIMEDWMYESLDRDPNVNEGVTNKFWNNYLVTYLKTSSDATYTCDAGWIKNPEKTVTIDTNKETAETPTTSTKAGGVGQSVTTPTQQDYLFKHWGANVTDDNSGSDYASNYQGIEYLDKDKNSVEIFTRPDDGSATNIETEIENFDGNTHYFIKDQRYKYSDCFTVNVWARMDNWEDYKTNNMRIFSCTADAGFNIEPEHNATDYIDFIGWDTGSDSRIKTSKCSRSKYTWTDLNTLNSGKSQYTDSRDGASTNWHMFTYVFDGNYIRGYIDGECIAISERFAKREMYYVDNHIVIGGEAKGAQYSVEPTTQHFVGDMKNFAIMHTALAPSQVKELYDNPGATNYYFAPEDKTLQAAWTRLPLLTAKEKESDTDGVTEIVFHTLQGEASTQTFFIQGNGKKEISLAVEAGENKPFALDNTSIANVNGGNIALTYTPEEGVTAHTSKLTITSDWSSDEVINITGRTHKFDIAYWHKDGFAVQVDDELAGCNIKLQVPGKSEYFVGKIDDQHADRTTRFIKLSSEMLNLSDLSDQEVAITLEHPTTGWKITSKRWVPKFITSGADFATAFNSPDRDVMIYADVTLPASTALTDAAALGDVYVHPDASLVLEENVTLHAQSLVLYSQGDITPQLVLPANSQLIINSSKPVMYLVKRVSNDRCYFFSLPYNCEVDDICFADGTGTKDVDWRIREYDGAERIRIDRGWKNVADHGTLYAGKGYSLAVATEEYKDVVFPMHLDASSANISNLDNEGKEIYVTAHGLDENGKNISGRTPNNLGWNFVGNRYLREYKHQDNVGENVTDFLPTGRIVLNDIENDGFLYLTIPYADGSYQYYKQEVYNSINLDPLSAFFVQADQSGLLKFIPDSRMPASLAARRVANATVAKPVYVGVSLSNDTYKDETSLVIGNQFTQAYEISSDLEKMLGQGTRPQVYIQDAAYKYAFKSLPVADAAETNVLGTYLPSAGTYTFAIKDSYDMSRVQTVHLTDKEKNITVNLLQTPYTFTVDAAQHTAERFYLSVVLAADVTTDMTQSAVTTWAVWQDASLQIRVQGLQVGDKVRVFDSMGHLVEQTIVQDTFYTFTLPVEGSYCIQTIGQEGIQAKKIIVGY